MYINFDSLRSQGYNVALEKEGVNITATRSFSMDFVRQLQSFVSDPMLRDMMVHQVLKTIEQAQILEAIIKGEEK